MTLHFDHSVIKINKDGSQSISDHMDEGEKLSDGRTYEDVLDSRAQPGVSASLPEDYEAPVPITGMTTDATNTNTAPVGSAAATGELEGTEDGQIINKAVIEENDLGEGADVPQTALTETENHDSSTIVPVEGEEANTDENSSDDDEADERPKDSDNKDAWFAYAQSKGFEGDRDDLTVKQFIEQYGN
jgi:hypothetical protein